MSKTKVLAILAGKLFDSQERCILEDQVIMIDRELGVILDVLNLGVFKRLHGNDDGIDFMDLGHLTIIPGLVDVHVHLFLHAYAETPWNDQVTKESLAERTIRATVHAQRTLMAGFTTVRDCSGIDDADEIVSTTFYATRDLGTEGALDADISLRKCLSGREPMISGPRYYCANRAIVTTGAYGPRSFLYPSNRGVEGVMGAEPVDGVDGCIREVRKQVGVGADWVKIYADYRVRAAMQDVSPSLSSKSIPTFNRQELEAMITTAHDLGVKVAAHANSWAAVEDLLDLGVDTIEHGAEIYNDQDQNISLIKKLAAAKGKTTWVPTLAAYHTLGESRWEAVKQTFVKAVIEEGVENIACGGDTGVFSHGENALELILMRKLGVPWEKVIFWATLGGWKCVRGFEWEGSRGRQRIKDLEANPRRVFDVDRGMPFGTIRKGWAADIVGIDGDLTGSPEEFEKSLTMGVKLVIKNGSIVKRVGK